MARVRLHLTLPHGLADEPVLYTLGRRFDVVTNIRRAAVDDRFAWVIVELDGDDEEIASATEWLAGRGVHVERLGDDDGGRG